MGTQFHSTRVAIVGVGNVGATCAYALLLRGLATEIVLVDVNKAKAEGEAMDLNHTVPFAYPTRIWAGDYADCAGAAVTVITAGVARLKPGQTRLDLVQTNAMIFRQIVPEVARHNPEGILLIASNPVDAMTFAAWKLSGLPSQRVIGSGTILDTARFRYLLSQHFGVDSRSVHAFIIGEHGDSEVPVWSLANIAGMRLQDFCAARGLNYDQTAMDDIFRQTREAAYAIMERKGATYYAIGAGLADIVEAILRDQSTVLSVSSLLQDYCGISDVCLSLPAALNQGGVEWVLPMDLNPQETEALCQSARVLKTIIAQLKLE
jgi:L-lactate dehydrogenase